MSSGQERGDASPTLRMIEAALAALQSRADPARAALTRTKGARAAIGVPPDAFADLVAEWRNGSTTDARIVLAEALWTSGPFEAALAAAKLLTQARIRPDAEVWALLQGWVAGLDDPTLGDAVAVAVGKRLTADPSRIAVAEGWCADPNPHVCRAALIATLPFARLNHPGPAERAARLAVEGWLDGLTADPSLMVRGAVTEWRHAAARHPLPG